MVAGIFGLTGASVAGYKVAKRTAGVDDFSFEKIGISLSFPLENCFFDGLIESPSAPKDGSISNGMHVTLWIPGWLVDSDFVEGTSLSKDLWQLAASQSPSGEHYSLVWERQTLLEWGDALQSFLTSKMASEVCCFLLFFSIFEHSDMILFFFRRQDIMQLI